MAGNVWTWTGIKRLAPVKAFERIDRGLEQLERILAKPTDRAAYKLITATAYTVRATDSVLFADATGGAITINLLDPRFVLGQRFHIKRMNAGANAVTVQRAGATIDGAASVVLATQWTTCEVIAYRTPSTFGYLLLPLAAAGGGGGGEANTASNVGTAGIGHFDGKVGVDLQFRKLNVGTGLVLTLDAPNQHLDLNVVGGADQEILAGQVFGG